MQRKTITRKAERRNNAAAFKSITDHHKAEKQLQEVLFAGYRRAVAAYFGSDLPKALVDRMNVRIAQLLTEGTEKEQDVEIAAPIQEVVAAYKAEQAAPTPEPTLEELADGGTK